MQRVGFILKVKQEKLEEYKGTHKNVWPEMQEALRNAGRHSGARRARIRVHEENGFLRLLVEDDGKGFAPSLDTGLGILGMQERVVSLSGTMTLNSKPGEGTVIAFDLPLPSSRRTEETTSSQRLLQEINPFRTA